MIYLETISEVEYSFAANRNFVSHTQKSISEELLNGLLQNVDYPTLTDEKVSIS